MASIADSIEGGDLASFVFFVVRTAALEEKEAKISRLWYNKNTILECSCKEKRATG